MSYSSEPSVHIEGGPQDSRPPRVNGEVYTTKSTPMSNNPTKTPASFTKRSEVLRHVFPRPSWSGTPLNQKSTVRVAKPEHRRSTLSSIRQSKSRVAFHRAITSFFNNSSPVRATPHPGSPRAGSSASSIGSRPGSVYESIPNLEVVSPGTFIFSGPSLRSTNSGSFSNASRLPSSTENGSESHSLRRVQSDLFSVNSVTSLDEGILEPFIEHGITRSMSDVLLGTNTPIEELYGPILEDLNEDGHSLSEDVSQRLQTKSPKFYTSIAAVLLPYLEASSRKALRLTCRSWHSAINHIAPPKFPPTYGVPNEILQQIYHYLGPKDFNAARHTCRNWMRASLNKNLLVIMLKRGAWWSSAESDLDKRNRMADLTLTENPMSDEWFLSRRLSRECSLSSAWTGNGLDTSRSHKSIVEVSQTDFADMANGYSGFAGRQNGGLVFTTSICGQLLLVARDTLVYIYDLRGEALEPLTSVSCPRRVLSMSMDVTSGRNAVAALLQGRMGMVCELRFGRNTGTDSPVEVHIESHEHPYRTTTRTSILTSRASEFDTGMDVADLTSPRSRRSSVPNADEQEPVFSSIDVQANYQAVSLQGTDDHRTHDQNYINHTWNLNLRRTPLDARSTVNSSFTGGCARNIPIESGTSTFYRHLCSEDDPPRSVSICPQRRCVAFGCSAGIELHWIDALTGQSLSRWFPLTAPSDYLYFLSPRPGFESAKKLRLISSAAHPDDRPAICRKFCIGRPTVSSFWGSFGFENNSRRPGPSSCDHYHAIPLSDGHHILFIDPPTGKLFMGCDAPLGGPTKLLRKISFVPPEGNQEPRLYTAAADLTWGARVVVAFGDTIMLYSVPPGVFTLSRLEQKAESWDVYTAPPFTTAGRTKDHWLNWWDEPNALNGPDHNCVWPNPIWPIAIRGTEIDTLRGVCELAVITKPDITIWGFTLDSQSKTWQLRNQAPPVNRTRRYICRSGIVHDADMLDEAGDVIMTDVKVPPTFSPAPTSEPVEAEVERSVGFDGNSSQVLVKCIPRALRIENDEWVDLLDVRGCDAWYNEDGDVLMSDPAGWEAEVLEESDVGALAGW